MFQSTSMVNINVIHTWSLVSLNNVIIDHNDQCSIDHSWSMSIFSKDSLLFIINSTTNWQQKKFLSLSINKTICLLITPAIYWQKTQSIFHIWRYSESLQKEIWQICRYQKRWRWTRFTYWISVKGLSQTTQPIQCTKISRFSFKSDSWFLICFKSISFYLNANHCQLFNHFDIIMSIIIMWK